MFEGDLVTFTFKTKSLKKKIVQTRYSVGIQRSRKIKQDNS